MKQRTVTWGMALALVAGALVCGPADAQPTRKPTMRTPARSAPSARTLSRPSASRAGRSGGSLSLPDAVTRRSPTGRDRTSATRSLGDALGSALGAPRASAPYRGGNGSGEAFLSELGRYLDQERYDRDHRSHDDRQYRAYRDTLIADTVLQVVGMVTSAQPTARTCAPPPAGPVYEVHRVLVEEGHYERYKVYIEPVYDRHTGALIDGGYYEVRTRWVPPRFEERRVRVR